jgi:hypothetical protein
MDLSSGQPSAGQLVVLAALVVTSIVLMASLLAVWVFVREQETNVKILTLHETLLDQLSAFESNLALASAKANTATQLVTSLNPRFDPPAQGLSARA